MLTETLGLTMEEYGQYTVLLDLIFVRGGAVPDDPELVRGPLRTNARGWRRIRDKLVTLGRIYIASDGNIRSARADREIQASKRRSDATSMAGHISAARKGLTQTKHRPNILKSGNEINGAFQQVLSNTETEADIREGRVENGASSAALESVVGAEAFPVNTSDNPISEQAATLQRGLGDEGLRPFAVSPYLAHQIRSRRVQ